MAALNSLRKITTVKHFSVFFVLWKRKRKHFSLIDHRHLFDNYDCVELYYPEPSYTRKISDSHET